MGTDLSRQALPFWSMMRLHWYHWAVLGLSLILTLGAWYVTSQQVQQKAKARFDFQSEQVIELVQERMAKYEEALWAGVAALHMHNDIASRDDWRVFANSLKVEDRFPGINGIGVIHFVPPAKRDVYLDWQNLDKPGFSIHPSHNNSEYWPITYIEPEESNFKAVGLDMAHEFNRYSAAQRAKESGLAQITGPIILVQDAQKTPGFLFYAPWYTKNEVPNKYGEEADGFLGLVYAPFIMHKLMDGTLLNSNRQVNFSIHDEGFELYSELSDKSENYDAAPIFSEKKTISFYGREWIFTVQTSKLFREQLSDSQPLMILIGGIFIDSLLLVIFVILSRANHQAVIYANQVTSELKDRQKELERARVDLERRNSELVEANSDLDQFAFIASHDLKAPLRGISQLVQWVGEDVEDRLTPETSKYFDLIKNRVSRLESLLDDLLVYSRIGRKEGVVEQVSIKQKIRELFDLMNPGEHLKLTVVSEVESMRTMVIPLEQVIRNLIGNAIKHHDRKEGHIVIEILRSDQSYVFYIKDDGPGIPLEHRERVFDLFHTLKPRDEVEGSGLGLSIIRKILDRYKSSYGIGDNGGRGCVFHFTWPLDNEISQGV